MPKTRCQWHEQVSRSSGLNVPKPAHLRSRNSATVTTVHPLVLSFHVLPNRFNRCLPVPAAHASLSRLCLYCVGQISWMPLTLVNQCGRPNKYTAHRHSQNFSISWSLDVSCCLSWFFGKGFPPEGKTGLLDGRLPDGLQEFLMAEHHLRIHVRTKGASHL